jgi:hypothetical protein
MSSEWHDLTNLTGNKEFSISRVTLKESGIAIEGEFELPPLGRLSFEDQVFVAEFIRVHGSIKQMEETFGVSYPTIKARLNRIASGLQFVRPEPVINREEILAKLERGEIAPKEAIEILRGGTQ